MQNKFLIYCALFITVLLMAACSKESSENLVEELFIDELLQPYFDTFVNEGITRGVTVDLEAMRIEGYIESIEEDNVLGQCQYNSTSPRRVIIDQAFWNSATTLQKEFVIFHELGHCYLSRSHDDEKNNNGTCKSMMQSGTTNCRFNYTQNSRATYLDELFGD